MASPEAFGNNSGASAGDGGLTNSLLDSASLSTSLEDNSAFYGLLRELKAAVGQATPSSELDRLLTADTTADNTRAKSPQGFSSRFGRHVDNAFDNSLVFNQPRFLPGSFTAPPQNQTSNSTQADIITGLTQNTSLQAVSPTFAITTEGTLTINNGGDFDGVPADPRDDARIHAGRGFTINGNPVLPVQRDTNGNPLRDNSGKLLLVDQAVTVAPGYTVSNGPRNQYANLLPPQVIDKQIVTVPAYADVRQQELASRIPAGTPTVTFNAQQNPINNPSDWASKFPASGTADRPTVVRVTNGGLNIPGNVDLSHYVITVESGDINFNGSGHDLNDVVLVTNNGNINLANVQSNNFSGFASGSLNMNAGSRFAGSTLLANGSNGSITFNGATSTATDDLKVISQGSITFNAATNTSGTFLSGGNITFNNNSTLLGAIGAKGNIIFNGRATITADPTETLLPVIAANLANDTAPSAATNTDNITSDPAIAGSVTNTESVARFRVGFDDTSVDSFVDVFSSLEADGSFNFNRTQLEQIYGGALPDGTHTLHLQAEAATGNVLSVLDISFQLDTTTPIISLDAPLAGGAHSSTARLIGSVADAGAGVSDVRYALVDNQGITPLTIDSQGQFDQALQSSPLSTGSHNVSLTMFDIAGNLAQTAVDFLVSDDFLIAPTQTAGWGAATTELLILDERDSFLVQTTIPVELGQTTGTRKLQFELDAAFDTTDQSTTLEDQLLMYLVDTANPSQTLLGRGDVAGTALFSLAGDAAEFTPGLVRYDGSTVEVDLTSIAVPTSGQLVFQLLNSDTDTGSVVRVKNLTNQVDPEGVTSPVFPEEFNNVPSGPALDLAGLNSSADLELELNNVRLDAATGQYTAELQVRNTGSSFLSRQIAIVFPDLPEGVQLVDPSGTDSSGSPYVNLRNAIRAGGLTPGASSDAVQLVFDNPNLVRFALQPEVLVGLPNQAPTFEPLGALSVMPGDRLELPLVATDSDGDRVIFSLQSDGPLPTGELSGNGTLIFRPTPEQLGTYNLTLVASDGAVETTQSVTLNVVADSVTTTRISGMIQNTDQQPLAGIPIELGDLQTVTQADGSFLLEVEGELPADTLMVHGEELSGSVVYPFIAEKLPLLLEHDPFTGVNNVISRPIYLPPIDVANAETIDPTQDVVVTTDAIPGAAVTVAAGTLSDQQGQPYTGQLSITEVPPDLTPAALPENLHPDLVVTIQPGEMVFTTPAPLSLPNLSGYAPGTQMDLWSINPFTGLFDNVGTGQVNADGSVIETISGGIRNSSWHFFAPPPEVTKDPNANPRNSKDDCDDCKATANFNSDVELHSGAVIESHDLVTYQSLGATRGLTLTYDSLRADPRPIVHFGYDNVDTNSIAPEFTDTLRLLAELKVRRGGFEYQVPGFAGGQYGLTGGEHFWSLPAQSGGAVDAALQVDLRALPSGQYDYSLTSGIRLFVRDQFLGSSSTSQGKFLHINSTDSAFGSGWGISGLQELVENEDGSILLIDGDGSELLFKAPTVAGNSYDAPPGDFSKLERLNDGTFRRTFTDQTVYIFNAQNKLERVQERNGNETLYVYNTTGQITKVVDPVGLETLFTYQGTKVSSIINPAGRITQMEYDAAGNLLRITDPDGTQRSWQYDGESHMTAEADKRGNHETAVYDFAGRAKQATRKDGSTVQVSPIQVQGLYSPEATINPLSTPSVFSLGVPEANYVDGNGNVVRTQLDQAGQAVSSNDGAGLLPSVQRNEQNLVTASTDAKGHTTNYTYDDQGNVTSRTEKIFSGPIDAELFPNSVYRTGEYPQLVVEGDLNADGNLDLVTLNQVSNDISVLLGQGDGRFGPKTDYALGADLTSMALGDLNGDGNMDLVVGDFIAGSSSSEGLAVSQEQDNLSVLLGQGDGSFGPKTDYTLENRPTSMALGDLNSDGELDLVIRSLLEGSGYGYDSQEQDNLSVLLGQGNGSFGPETEYVVGDDYAIDYLPSSVSLDDLNNDGQLDVVTANAGSDVVSVLLGQGDGTLAAKTDYEVGSRPSSVAVDDLNGDGQLDVLTANNLDNTVSVLLGQGNGTLAAKTDYAVGTGPISIAVDDLSGDGQLDVIVANTASNNVSVLLGQGNGILATKTDYAVRSNPRSVVLADFNGDAQLDVITADAGFNSLSVLLGQGNGTLSNSIQQSDNYTTGSRPTAVSLGDLNNDGVLDVVTPSINGDTVSVLLGRLDSTFTSPVNYSIGYRTYTNPTSVVLGDLNSDSYLDIITTSSYSATLSVLLGRGDGSFSVSNTYQTGSNPQNSSLGDLNGDGNLDIVTPNPGSDNISVMLGLGNGSFTTITSYAVGDVPNYVSLGDLNRDGHLDIAVANLISNNVSVLLGLGNGNFTTITSYAVGDLPTFVSLDDLNRDGYLDIAAANLGSENVSVLLGLGNGSFGSRTDYALGSRFDDITLGDVNGDRYLDIVTAASVTNSVSVLLNNSDGTFAATTDYVVGSGPRGVALGDLDGDDDVDIVSANISDSSISVLRNSTNGNLITARRRYTYDPVFNQLTSETDELGRQTLYEIDPTNGNVLSMTRVVGAVGGTDDVVTRYTYTSQWLVDMMTDPLGRVTDYDYDSLGRLVKTTFALGTADAAVQQYEYDASGNQTASIDEKGNRTQFEYDDLNRLVDVAEADPDGAGPLSAPVTALSYDAAGNLLTTTDARGNITQNEYDALDRLTQTTDALNGETRWGYDLAGNMVSVANELGHTTQMRYDSRNRPLETIDPEGGRTQLRYDANNNLTSVFDELGNRTNFVYDARNRLNREVDPLGQAVTYSYNLVNNLVTLTNQNGHKTGFEYDELNRQTQQIDALNDIATTTYDAVGNVLSRTDELDRTTNYSYDNRNRLTGVTDPLGGVTTYGYDAVGNLLAFTDELNRTTRYSYDALNRQSQMSDPLNHATAYAYDGVGNLTAIADALGRTTQYDYDALNRRSSVTNALGDTATTTYDAADNITAVTDELGRTTRFTYDDRNLQTAVIDSLGHTTITEYDAVGNVTAVSDALGHTTSYSYDPLYRPTEVTDADGQTTTTTYDAVGNVLFLTDPESNTTTYTYDELERVASETNALGQTHFFIYDAVGNRVGELDRNHQVRVFNYDALDRQTQEIWLDVASSPVRTSSYTYDAASQLTAASDPDSSYSYSYDAAGRLTSVDNAGTPGASNVVLNYTYDAVNNQLAVTDTINGQLRGTESFAYDDLNRTTQITQSGTGVAEKRVDMAYDTASQMTGLTRYTDLTGTQLVADSDYTYDNAGRLTRLTHARNATTLADYNWTYDAANRITQSTSPDGTSTYSYDTTDQLTAADHSFQADEGYSYDANGNRINTGYQTGTNNRLLSDGKYNYEYDNEGNRTKRTETTTGEVTEYNWDYRNRLTQVVTKDASGNVIKQAEYTYDIFDRRITKTVDPDGAGSAIATVERLVYDGEHIALTFDGNGTQTNRYLHGTEIDQILASENAQGEVLWALTDNQGTVRDLVDSTGTIQNHITYDSFGQIINETNTAIDTRFGYTGREFDSETGQYYYRARYYDAGVGRFISEDPIGFAGGDPNLSRYVGNSPTNATDPSGLFLDILADAGFIAYDVYKLVKDNVLRNCNNLGENLAALGADTAGALIPFATGGGLAVHAAAGTVRRSDDIRQALGSAAHLDDAADLGKGLDHVPGGLDNVPTGKIDDIGNGGYYKNPFGDLSVDDLINSSLRPARTGAEESRALQGLKKKIDRGNPAFAGLPKTQETTNKIIREVFDVDNPIVRTGTNRNGEAYVEVFNSDTGRGVRTINDQFDTFVNLN